MYASLRRTNPLRISSPIIPIDSPTTSSTVSDEGEVPSGLGVNGVASPDEANAIASSPDEAARDENNEHHHHGEEEEVDLSMCCYFWNIRESALLFNGITMFMSIFIPVLGVFGIISVVEFSAYTENLLHIDQDAMDQLYHLEHESWLFQLVIGSIVSTLTLVPTYGVYRMHMSMIAFGMVLLVGSTLVRCAVGWMQLEKANQEIICPVSTKACQYNSFRQPYVMCVASAVVVAIFLYPHAYLVWAIYTKRSLQAPHIRRVTNTLLTFVFSMVFCAGAYSFSFQD